MVTELLVEETPEITASNIQAGWEFLHALDEAHVPVEAAFWHYRESSLRWRFYLATPLVGMQGQIKTYAAFNTVLDTLPDDVRERFIPSTYSVLDTNERQVRELRRIYGTMHGERGRREQVTLLGEFYLYRL